MKTMLFVYIALMIFGALRTIIRFVARRKRRKKGEDATMLQAQESKTSLDFQNSSLVSGLIDILGKLCHVEIEPTEDGQFKVITTMNTEELIAMLASKFVL